MKGRNTAIIVVIVLVALFALFPTAHPRTREDIVRTIDCSRTLEEGEFLQESLTDMQDKTKIIVNITSNENVQVFLTGINDSATYDIYSLVETVHTVQHTIDYTSYNVTVWNPTDPENGSSATMSGSIEVHRIYEVVDWLPWWMS